MSCHLSHICSKHFSKCFIVKQRAVMCVQTKARQVSPPGLKLEKSHTAFLCSSSFSSTSTRKCHRWINSLLFQSVGGPVVVFSHILIVCHDTFTIKSHPVKTRTELHQLPLYVTRRLLVSPLCTLGLSGEWGLLMQGANRKRTSPGAGGESNTIHQVASGYCKGQNIVRWNHFYKLDVYWSLGENRKRASRWGVTRATRVYCSSLQTTNKLLPSIKIKTRD